MNKIAIAFIRIKDFIRELFCFGHDWSDEFEFDYIDYYEDYAISGTEKCWSCRKCGKII